MKFLRSPDKVLVQLYRVVWLCTNHKRTGLWVLLTLLCRNKIPKLKETLNFHIQNPLVFCFFCCRISHSVSFCSHFVSLFSALHLSICSVSGFATIILCLWPLYIVLCIFIVVYLYLSSSLSIPHTNRNSIVKYLAHYQYACGWVYRNLEFSF